MMERKLCWITHLYDSPKKDEGIHCEYGMVGRQDGNAVTTSNTTVVPLVCEKDKLDHKCGIHRYGTGLVVSY